jgi:GTP-binding protein
MKELRNIAIIAHVDHGKTTLVDALLRQSMSLAKDAGQELIMDSNDLERERGITIFSKNAAIEYNGVKINIVDTPGHADFGGEVERIMSMVDGCLLLVDAKEGPMPQTKFVLKKAVEAGHRVIVVINKIDKSDARIDWVIDQTFDLFVSLGASDEQTDFPILYASGVQGKAGLEPDLAAMTGIQPMFDKILEVVPPPRVKEDAPLQFLTVSLVYDNYKGKMAVGRLYAGTLRRGQEVMHIDRAGAMKRARVSALSVYAGIGRLDVEEVQAGDIACVAGIDGVSIGETLADMISPVALPVISIEQPTVKMSFGPNTSPLAGREGKFCTSRHVRERLAKELETDVALRVEPLGEKQEVSGRGELHLAILIEKMRREGYELEVSRPQVILKEIDGVTSEPIEQVYIEVPEVSAGIVIERLGQRRAEMRDMRVEGATAHLEFEAPTRGLIGYRAQFLTDTKGLGIINTIFKGYEPHRGHLGSLEHGSLIAFESGKSVTYGLLGAQERGQLFIGPGVEVYAGMIVGENARADDMEVNVCKEKKLTNMRSKGDGVAEALDVPRAMTLEEAIDFIGDDEMVEVTPVNIRLRKTILDHNDRKRQAKDTKG